MIRAAVIVVAALAFSGVARAGAIEWTDADKAELAKLAKSAKKNGELFTVANDIVEARLPTREAAAEFFLYYDRFAKCVRPLWGTRENTIKPITIVLFVGDVKCPEWLAGRKVHFHTHSSQGNSAAGIPSQLAALNIYLDPALANESLSVSAIEPWELNHAGAFAFLSRLGGRNKRPDWMTTGMSDAFKNWSPVTSGSLAQFLATLRTPESTKLIEAERAKTDPIETLLPWFTATALPLAPPPSKAGETTFQSFFAFMLEHKRGREFFVDSCECVSLGKPLKIDQKVIGKLVPHWLEWAGMKVVPAK